MTSKQFLKLIGMLLGIIGWTILFFVNWKIALGVLIMIWGNNVERRADNL